MIDKKRAILIIHGLAGSPLEHTEMLNYLKNKFDIYSYYLPGHEKGILNHPTKEDWINESEKQIKSLYEKGYEEIYLIGHSMGGVIASYLASKYERIKKLVLEAPAFEYNSNPGFKILKYYDKKFLFAVAKRFLISIIKEFKELVSNYKSYIEKVNIPILIIQGQDDIMVPYESSIKIYNKIKNDCNHLVLIKDSTHSLFYDEKYNEIIKMVEDFLINNEFDSKIYNEELNKELVKK